MTARVDATLILDDDPLEVRATPLPLREARQQTMLHVGPLSVFGYTDQIRAALTAALAALDGIDQ